MTHKKKIGTVAYYVVGILIAILAIIPFLWMVSTSLKARGALMSIPIEWIPKEPTIASYVKVFSKFPFFSTIGNSLFISVTYTFITLISASMAAFAFAKLKFPKADLLLKVFLATMMIPTQVTIIPLFVVMNKMSLINSYASVILPSIFRPFAVFLLVQQMRTIPNDYLDAASIDGAYTILEQPKAPSPTQEKPIWENPVQANPMLDAPIQENPAQLNKEESSNYPSKTDLSITQESSPILSSPPVPRERSGQDGMRKRESYRALILENIEYDVLSQNVQLDKDRLDELVELMVDTVCSNREMIRVAGDDYPAEVVRSRFLKLNASHIEYVLDRMRENTTYVRNIKKYLLAALYNAPVTMDSYYTSLVSHDLYGSGDRR